MLNQSFFLNLKNPVTKNSVCIARLDGKNPSLVCGTIGGKVFIYTPSGVSEENVDVNI